MKRLLLLSVAVVFFMLGGIGCQFAKSPSELMAGAREAYRAHKYEEAAKYCKQALKKDKHLAEAHLLLSMIYDKEGIPSKAFAEAKAAAKLRPDDPKIRENLGMIAVKTSHYPEAYEALKPLVKKGKTVIVVAFADAAFLTGRQDEALAVLHERLARQPTSAGYTKLGELLWRLGRTKESIEAYRQALALDTTNVAAGNNLAYIYARENLKLDRALQLANEAVSYAPTNPNFLDTLGYVLYKRGEYNKAAAALEQAEESRPDPEFRAHLAMVLVKLDKARPRAYREMLFALRAQPELLEDPDIKQAALKLQVIDAEGNLLQE